MQSPDGFLISALIRCYDMRLQRGIIRVNRISRWKNGLAIFCMIVAIVSLSWMPHTSLMEKQSIVFSSLFVPLVYGWIIGIAVLHHTQLPADEENGIFALWILEAIAEMNPSYASTFFELLTAIIDENGPYAVLLAGELDAGGLHIKEFTTLVREAFG